MFVSLLSVFRLNFLILCFSDGREVNLIRIGYVGVEFFVFQPYNFY
jgi:hypothetical protein